MTIKNIAGLLIVALVLANTPGCVGYQLGSSLPPDIKSVFVRTFINKCNEPLIEIEATNATIAEFQKDGTLKIGRLEEADVVLETTLTAITLEPLRFDRQDTSKPNEYRLIMSAIFVLKRQGSGKMIGEGECIGESTFLFGGNLASAKRSAIPKASEDLAKRIVEKVVEVW
ncbi:MAG: hypothetical protein KKE37_03125 [Verrucomicrobia bacterium]|nr:hypothetical protein [Verrucomicrobiota bacterium]MBU4291667.1 hypothetical protein [Verrucomicrobiota bacterium]MBU4428329.1 hypothetical protein [Verrucomicrobiota bacterium]MCG2681088.1 LPS assembly lipoprotein LptE [Kiritimatiellia bacterium]